ncbi:MAG: hypothetical protein DMG96_20800 [Acidobacteria bacterium]|nr:MAG: hypothetical protein DMG96_20800 [Acidobacteriota bacterium]
MNLRIARRSSISRYLRVWLGVGFLFSGAALIVSIFQKVNLGILLLLLGIAVGCIAALVWKSATSQQKHQIKARISTGLWAGILATLAYDLIRVVIVRAGHLTFLPFHAFYLFGQLIAGKNVSAHTALAIGTAYHYMNGIMFSIAYCYFLAGRKWLLGIGWSLSLEIIVLIVYPAWLGLQGMMAEFTVVSLCGHLAYGSVLGVIAARKAATGASDA